LTADGTPFIGVNWFYTFSWINDECEVEDASSIDLYDDEGLKAVNRDNRIGVYSRYGNAAARLNNIIFIGSSQYDSGMFYSNCGNIFEGDN
jgi:hypothetical protein